MRGGRFSGWSTEDASDGHKPVMSPVHRGGTVLDNPRNRSVGRTNAVGSELDSSTGFRRRNVDRALSRAANQTSDLSRSLKASAGSTRSAYRLPAVGRASLRYGWRKAGTSYRAARRVPGRACGGLGEARSMSGSSTNQMKTKRAAAWRPDPASVVLQIVEEVANELHPGQTAIRATLDSRLDRDLRVDSLGRAELLLRVERAFAVSLPEHTLGQAETPRDLLTAILARQSVGPLARSRSRRATTAPLAVPEPVNAETLCAVLDWHAEHHGDRVHIRLEQSDEQSSAIASGTLAQRARRAACGLRELDV